VITPEKSTDSLPIVRISVCAIVLLSNNRLATSSGFIPDGSSGSKPIRFDRSSWKLQIEGTIVAETIFMSTCKM